MREEDGVLRVSPLAGASLLCCVMAGRDEPVLRLRRVLRPARGGPQQCLGPSRQIDSGGQRQENTVSKAFGGLSLSLSLGRNIDTGWLLSPDLRRCPGGGRCDSPYGGGVEVVVGTSRVAKCAKV